MKVKHLVLLSALSLGLVGLIAHASTPQEDIVTYTNYITDGAKYGANHVASDYAQRAIAYAKAGQWQNCLNDMNWLKTNKIYTWSSWKGVPEARTQALLALGRTDEAVQDMYETFLSGCNTSDLRRLKEFIAKNPQYSNYLDLNARADLIQKYQSSAKEMWTSADYTSGIRGTENGWYMLQVAEKMVANEGLGPKYQFYDTYHRIANNRYETCKWHSDDPAYGTSGSTRETFIANGSIACSDVLSQEGMEDGLRIAETAAQTFMQQSGSTGYTSSWKQAIKGWNDRLGRSSASAKTSTPSNSVDYSSSSNTNSLSPETVLDTVNDGVEGVNSFMRGIRDIRSGLKDLGL